MEIFKEASKVKLRVPTPKGNLSVEQLWDLSLNDLDATAVKLEEEVEKSATKSFLKKTTAKSKTAKLTFDVVVAVLTDKMEAQDKAAKAAETRKKNERIDELIARKQEQHLEGLSIEELEKLRTSS